MPENMFHAAQRELSRSVARHEARTRRYYGLDGQEELDDTPGAPIRRMLDEGGVYDPRTGLVRLDSLPWPQTVYEYRLRDCCRDATTVALGLLDQFLEELDDEYGVARTDATPAMIAAAEAFAAAVVDEYRVRTCERTGREIEYTIDDARRLLDQARRGGDKEP